MEHEHTRDPAAVDPAAVDPVVIERAALAAGQPAPADQPGGHEALERLRGFGGDRLLRDMARIFVTDMPARLVRARAGVASDDARAVAYAAHMMKSSSAQFGAEALVPLCAAAERAAGAGELAAVPTLLDGIERELAAYFVWLERELPPGRAST